MSKKMISSTATKGATSTAGHPAPACNLRSGSLFEEWRRLWTQVNGAGSWDANPFVWIVRFLRVEQREGGHGILFSAPMVKAILSERKTVTRRVVQPQPDEDGLCRMFINHTNTFGPWIDSSERVYDCPYEAGQTLWVRESFRADVDFGRRYMIRYRADDGSMPVQDENMDDFKSMVHKHANDWRPSIFMFRWASRIQLRVTDVDCARVWDVSEEDIKREGVTLEAANG